MIPVKVILKSVSNLKLAISLFLIIAIISGLGSVIEQEKALDFYIKSYPQQFLFLPIWRYITFFQLDHIYSAVWFYCLLVGFGICLLSCTLTQQLPTLKFARRFYFFANRNQFSRFAINFTLPDDQVNKTCFHLCEQQNYSVFHRAKSIYLYKGLIGRVGPIIVHFSIICILMGSLIGALGGFTAQEFIPRTEVFNIQNLIHSGDFASVPSTTFRVNDFWIQYGKDENIKQFQSNLSVLDKDGTEKFNKTISVNKPLVYKGLTIYQTDWGISGARVILNDNMKTQLPIAQLKISNKKFWVSGVFKENSSIQPEYLIIIENEHGKIVFYDQETKDITTGLIDESKTLSNNTKITVSDFIVSTGLQIKSDPGVKIIYFGFALLIISSLISYISFSEIWILGIGKGKNLIGGQTNRAKIQFELELRKVKQLSSIESL